MLVWLALCCTDVLPAFPALTHSVPAAPHPTPRHSIGRPNTGTRIPEEQPANPLDFRFPGPARPARPAAGPRPSGPDAPRASPASANLCSHVPWAAGRPAAGSGNTSGPGLRRRSRAATVPEVNGANNEKQSFHCAPDLPPPSIHLNGGPEVDVARRRSRDRCLCAKPDLF